MSANEIIHPDEVMTIEQRAVQMWRVHPNDLDRLGFKHPIYANPRQSFFEAHVRAAVRQALEGKVG